MNADVFNQGDWRDLAKCRSGIERVLRNTLEAPASGWLYSHETLWPTYWIVALDTIQSELGALSTVTSALSIEFQPTRFAASWFATKRKHSRLMNHFREIVQVSRERFSIDRSKINSKRSSMGFERKRQRRYTVSSD